MPRLLSICLIAAFVLGATASGANPDASVDVGDEEARTWPARTARVETVIRVTGGSTAETYELRSIGVLDHENGSSDHRMEPSGCRTITIDDVGYAETPVDEGFPAGKHWMRFGGEIVDSESAFEQSQKQPIVGDGTAIASLSISFAAPESTPDEHLYLNYLREISGEPELVGQEDVRGVSTTHYRTTLNVQDVARKQLETEGWEADNIERAFKGIAIVRELDVWVGSDGFVRRIVTADSPAADQDWIAGSWTTTTEFFDFGLETDIQPPPAAEVLSAEELQRVTDNGQQATQKEMRLWLEANHSNTGEGIALLPEAFDPATLPRGGPEQPASCLH